MTMWVPSQKPDLSICPKQYCFNWAPPKGKADLSGKVYDSFEEAITASQSGVTFLHGGCAATFGPCRRGTNNSTDRDFYEPFESILRRNNLPELFFCNPEFLDNEFSEEYQVMAEKLWGKNA
jgi:hypothetical protein